MQDFAPARLWRTGGRQQHGGRGAGRGRRAAQQVAQLARRGRALNAVATPAPLPVLPAPIAPVAAPPSEPSEKPLPTWVRLAIVAAALLAFLAVSLLATRSD